MVSKCIKCGKILKNYSIYCDKCENEIKTRIEKEENFKKKYQKADFFQRQKLK